LAARSYNRPISVQGLAQGRSCPQTWLCHINYGGGLRGGSLCNGLPETRAVSRKACYTDFNINISPKHYDLQDVTAVNLTSVMRLGAVGNGFGRGIVICYFLNK